MHRKDDLMVSHTMQSKVKSDDVAGMDSKRLSPPEMHSYHPFFLVRRSAGEQT